jgi:hypothetical protein
MCEMGKPEVRSRLVGLIVHPGRNPSTVDTQPTVDPIKPASSTVDEITPSTVDRFPAKEFRARTVQDAHTVWEQALYEAMWRLGARGDDVRTVTAGYRTLARAAHQSDKAVSRNLETLEAKLAIETAAPEDTHHRVGRTYRVYSFKAILERRRLAGMELVRRYRNAVSLSTVDMQPTGDGIASPSTVDTQSTGTMDTQSPSTVDMQSIHLGSNRNTEECPRCNGTGRWLYESPLLDGSARKTWITCDCRG